MSFRHLYQNHGELDLWHVVRLTSHLKWHSDCLSIFRCPFPLHAAASIRVDSDVRVFMPWNELTLWSQRWLQQGDPRGNIRLSTVFRLRSVRDLLRWRQPSARTTTRAFLPSKHFQAEFSKLCCGWMRGLCFRHCNGGWMLIRVEGPGKPRFNHRNGGSCTLPWVLLKLLVVGSACHEHRCRQELDVQLEKQPARGSNSFDVVTQGLVARLYDGWCAVI